ncbi:MAG: ROK family protein [Propionibacteriaceae bacterium]|nr:ROK family protein [Propionibacteriaceae bacterium]
MNYDASVPQFPLLHLPPPKGVWRADTPAMLSVLCQLVASGQATTKASLVTAMGLARSTVSSYVDILVRKKMLTYSGIVERFNRGRPAEQLDLSSEAGLVLAIDLGVLHANLAIGEFGQRVIARRSHRIDVRDGPEVVLGQLCRELEEDLERVGQSRQVRSIVIGIPARVDGPSGVAVHPNIMPGWDGYPISLTLQKRFGAVAILENDAMLRAIGEAATLEPDQLPVVAIKIGTGVGAGIVDHTGHVFHGFSGSAGDIGHTKVCEAAHTLCTCGMEGCVEAVASVPSMIRTLHLRNPSLFDQSTDQLDQLLEMVRRHQPDAIAVVRQAAETLGAMTTTVCHTINPRRVVISGELTNVTDELLSGIRAYVYRHARPLTTRDLSISHSRLGESGLAGALVAARHAGLSPESLRRVMATF